MPANFPEISWDFVVCDLNGTTISEVSPIATQKQLRYRLNRPAECSFTVPSDDARVSTVHTDGDPFLSCSNRVLKGYRSVAGTKTLQFAGIVMQVTDEGDADRAQTSCTAFDPSQLLYHRLVRTVTGTVDTAPFTTIAGGTIAKNLIDRTVTYEGSVPINTGGSVAATTAQTVTFEQGTTVGQALESLTDTDTMDVVFTPLDGSAGLFVTFSIVAARGSAKPDAVFGYGAGNYSVSQITRILDGTEMANDVSLAYGQRPDAGTVWPTSRVSDATNITKYGWYESWETIDVAVTNSTLVGVLAAAELSLRKKPKEYLNITPFPEKGPQPFTDYFLGDTIQIWTAATFRQAVTASQRVYGITIDIDESGFERVGQIVSRA